MHYLLPKLAFNKKKGYVQEGLTIEMQNREEMSQEDHTKTAQYFYQVITRERVCTKLQHRSHD
jgi:hypothetical protein